MRAAAGGVDDDEIDVAERAHQLARERLALLEAARMDGQRAAAALRRGDDLEPVRCEDTGSGAVHVREDR